MKNKVLRYAKKIKSINYLGGVCINCKEDNIFKLTFHHRNIDEKEFEYCDEKDKRWSDLKKELDKCDVLCNNCHRELHYKIDVKYNEFRRNDKKIYLDYAGAECIKCGYDKCPASLTFHHRIQEEKEFWIGGLSERLNSIYELSEKIRNEMDKCDILCANCHTIEHSDVEYFEKNKIEIYEKVENYKEKQGKIDRMKVYEMYDSGMKQIEIAKHFNASKGTISGIMKERWGDSVNTGKSGQWTER